MSKKSRIISQYSKKIYLYNIPEGPNDWRRCSGLLFDRRIHNRRRCGCGCGCDVVVCGGCGGL